ncbi:MAG TPA: hypothetical protein PLX69_10585 [Leptospiraceae bacterium]|nr:hypothetical protein [Leptospiraceae bacterium]
MMKVHNKLEVLDPLIFKISELPESIQLQVLDYVEYLYSKHKPRIKNVEVKLSEEEKIELLRRVEKVKKDPIRNSYSAEEVFDRIEKKIGKKIRV